MPLSSSRRFAASARLSLCAPFPKTSARWFSVTTQQCCFAAGFWAQVFGNPLLAAAVAPFADRLPAPIKFWHHKNFVSCARLDHERLSGTARLFRAGATGMPYGVRGRARRKGELASSGKTSYGNSAKLSGLRLAEPQRGCVTLGPSLFRVTSRPITCCIACAVYT